MIARRLLTILGAYLIAVGGVAHACFLPHDARIRNDPAPIAQRSAVVVLGRVVTPSRAEYGALETATIEVVKVFKGDVPATYTYRHRVDECSGRPPVGELVYLFLQGQIDAPFWQSRSFVTAARAAPQFDSKLGSGRTPLHGANVPSPVPLAPPGLPSAALMHLERDGVPAVAWMVDLPEPGHWAVPRFYVRYPGVFLFFSDEDVLAATRSWRDPDLVRYVRGAVPLKTPVDLYQFTLMGSMPRVPSVELDRFVVESLLAGRVTMHRYRQVRVTRTQRGEQFFSAGEDEKPFLESRFDVFAP